MEAGPKGWAFIGSVQESAAARIGPVPGVAPRVLLPVCLRQKEGGPVPRTEANDRTRFLGIRRSSNVSSPLQNDPYSLGASPVSSDVLPKTVRSLGNPSCRA
jgi:hypothetical protein